MKAVMPRSSTQAQTRFGWLGRLGFGRLRCLRILIEIGAAHHLPGSDEQQRMRQGQGKEINHRRSHLAGAS